MSTPSQRYTAVAIVLHWAIAAAILFLLPLGLWMHEAVESGGANEGVYAAYQLHKSVGLTVLALSLARLGWRLFNPPPPMPAHMPAWERIAAKATHWIFYALIIAMPLSGWIFVSAGWSIHDNAPLAVPTRYFGWFEVPHLFGLASAGAEARETAAKAAFAAHALSAYAAMGLIVLHIGAALKHQFFDRDEVLAHMLPGVRAPFETQAPPRNAVRLAILGGGLALTLVALVSGVYTVSGYVGGAAPTRPQQTSTIEVAAPTAPAQTSPAPQAQTAEPTSESGVAGPPSWQVDQRASSVGFAYVYSDESGETPMNGRFTRWNADIRFDPANLGASYARVSIDTASASTGVAAHDSALPGAGWFNVAAYPNASFRTTRIRRDGDRYVAEGDLTIRDRTRAVELPFTLRIDGTRATMSGAVTIDRRDFDLGEGALGDDSIERNIEIRIRVEAARAP